jgi:hypothetical protein
MGEVSPARLNWRLNFEIDFPRIVRKGFGKLPYRACRDAAGEQDSPGNFLKIGQNS